MQFSITISSPFRKSGKSTMAILLKDALENLGVHVVLVDKYQCRGLHSDRLTSAKIKLLTNSKAVGIWVNDDESEG
jgi:adenylylsulfate kinase-like enzyme